jgi:hypothetical protein
MKLIIAFILSALSFPGQIKEFPPHQPAPERIEWEVDRSWTHNFKNLTTETVRADTEFWSKAFLFVIMLEFAAIVVLLAKQKGHDR